MWFSLEGESSGECRQLNLRGAHSVTVTFWLVTVFQWRGVLWEGRRYEGDGGGGGGDSELQVSSCVVQSGGREQWRN